MKKIIKIWFSVLLAASLFTSCMVRGGFVIRERPDEPYYIQPAPPYPGAVWIASEWVWRSGHYVYIHGYYTHPRYAQVWEPGHWHQVEGGYVWERGHWK